MTRLPLLLPALLLLAGAASRANSNCDTIRAQIEAKVRASGVTDFSLQVVAADAKIAGKVVGSCDLGTRRIVYAAGTSGAGPASAAGGDARILTECKDGTVTYGDCRK